MKIAVIGGGASGLVASIVAAKNGAKVTIYEKLNKVGKKILATGNGRCNYTNMYMSINRFHSKNIELILPVLDFFDRDKTISFFEELGIYPFVDKSGKVYPNSLQSSSVLDVLRYEASRLGVEEIVDFEVVDIKKTKDGFIVKGVENSYDADKVIICTGGKASPQLGSTGQGYELAKHFGHTIVEPFPALVQLKLEGSYFKRISGVRFDGRVSCYSNNELIREDEDEILYTDYGISGPAILQVSRKVIESLNKPSDVNISIDMFPSINSSELYEILKSRFSKIYYKSIEDSLVGLINKKLIPVMLIEAGFVENSKECGKLNKKEIYKIVKVLKEWKFKVIGYNSWQDAQTTAGGVDLSQVNNKTLESKKTKDLYLAGEILDVDGDCGGFNLQWAWSSGYVAGFNSSNKDLKKG